MVKFLIIRFSSIGDIVLTTPVIRCLKEQVDQSEVHFLTKSQYAGLLEENPYLDQIHSLDEHYPALLSRLRAEQFDYIIDLQNSLRSARTRSALKRMYFAVDKLNLKKWLFVNLRINRLPEKHIVDRYLETTRLFDVKNDGRGLDYHIPAGTSTERLIPELKEKSFVAMAIGAQHTTKKMPAEMLAELSSLVERPVVLLGGKEDSKAAEEIVSLSSNPEIQHACGSATVHESAMIIQQSSCLVTHDTGMMHIAAALKKPVVTIWGNTVPLFGMYPYLPGKGSVSFEVSDLRCRPCSKIGHQRCPKKHFRCMKDHNLKEIAAAVNSI